MVVIVDNVKTFLRSAPRQFKVMITRSSVANFVGNINPYNSIYIVALGASEVNLGFLTSISSGLSAISAMSTSWISDKIDKKKMLLIGASIALTVPIFYSIASTWSWLIMAFILAGLSDGIFQPAWNAMYVNSMNSGERGTLFGLANSLILVPTLIAPLIGGFIVLNSGGLTSNGIRPLYVLQFLILFGALIFIWRYLEKEDKKVKLSFSINSLISDYKQIWDVKGARVWILMKSLGSISIGMAGPFWILYASVIHHASAMTIATMVTARLLANISFSPLVGKLTDKKGKKLIILIGRGIMYAGLPIFLFSNVDWHLILTWILYGISDATGVAWTVEECELVTESSRSRMTAMSLSAFNLLAVPSAILGGYLWESVSPIAPFIVMAIIDGCIRMSVIYLYVPEANKK